MTPHASDDSLDGILDESIRRLDPLVEDLYEESEQIDASELEDASSLDDLCPLYNTILQITDRYPQPELIGRGSMKDVYRVYDARTARYVALARPLEKYSSDHYDAFLREAHLTARLEHPCIIDLFDMDVDADGRPFFTMEFKRGRSLREILNDLRQDQEADEIPLRNRFAIFLRVCEAIAYAHSRRILHLDIKPENIQVGEFGETQVCDWGLGVVMPRDEQLRDSEVLLDPDLYGDLLDSVRGTPIYMSPEQKQRQTIKTPQMDIYALGCLLCEIVTLKPYEASLQLVRETDSAMVAMIAKATAADPADRYESVNHLRDDITRYLGGYSASVERSSVLREAALFYRRHREVCAVTLGALILLTMSLSFFVVELRRKQQVALAAQADAETAWIKANKERGIADVAKGEAEKEREIADVARGEAERARGRAEESLARYVVEKNKSEDRLNRQATSAVSMSKFLTSMPLMNHNTLARTVKLSIEHLDTVLSNEPSPDSRAWHNLFKMYFLTQDFASATRLLDGERVIDPDFTELSITYEPKCNASGYLDTDDFIALVDDLCRSKAHRAPLAEMMLVYDLEHPRSTEDRARLVRKWVRVNNPGWQLERMIYDPEAKAVRLHGVGLRSLSRTLSAEWPPGVRLNLLYTLNPKKLDLRGTSIEDLTQLEGLELLELDLRNTPISDLSPLAESRSLRRLIIDAGQFTETQIATLPDSIEITVVEDELS